MITDFQIELMLAVGLVVWGYLVFVRLSQDNPDPTLQNRELDLRAHPKVLEDLGFTHRNYMILKGKNKYLSDSRGEPLDTV